jgi:hypothetical protein
MSHIVTIQTQVRSFDGISAACRRLELLEPTVGEAKLFTSRATGVIVRLPQWRFPVVFDLDAATIQFDNYKGAWGKQEHLDRFLQAYSIETAKLEARKKGYSVTETSLKDGSVKLVVHVGGAA